MNYSAKVSINEVKSRSLLFVGLNVLQENSISSSVSLEQPNMMGLMATQVRTESTEVTKTFPDLATNSCCNTCSYQFESRTDQVGHYKSDWHRHNIKSNLLNRPSLSFEEFENIVDDLSSISGSESSDPSDADEEIYLPKSSKLFNDQLSQSKHITEYDVTENTTRSPLIYFTNADNSILSVYKCSITMPKDNQDIPNYVVENFSSFNDKICIILLNAGHFAAAVFQNNAPVVHKTFHRYVVRAKRGTVQSQRDQKGSAPKSGGASLRRHNESELAKSIHDLLDNWEEYLTDCKSIFIRSPKYNKEIFYGGKQPILKKNDERVKGIPFSTKRPTFNEIKRVYGELFSVKIYSGCEKEMLLKEFTKSMHVSPTPDQENIPEENNYKVLKTDHKNDDQPSSINSAPSTASETDGTKEIAKNNEADATNLQEANLVISAVKQMTIFDDLYTVCKIGDVETFRLILSNLTDEDRLLLGNDFGNGIDNHGNNLLHVAAKSGKVNMIHELLSIGCDPCTNNNSQQTPYSVSCDKNTKNSFRKFMANHPNMYDYVKANIPGPLTEDMETEMKIKQNQKKKAKKQIRKEKQKAKAVETENHRLENEAKEKFANMSDREKRALAAEKRLVKQAREKGEVLTLSAERCWKCGESLLGKVPFEYSSFKFCSIKCLKLHKGLIKK